MAKIGDMVRFLNAVGGGRIVKINNNLAYVEDEDGFEHPTPLRELVVVQTAEAVQAAAAATKKEAPAARPATTGTPATPAYTPMADPEPVEIKEIPGADVINVVIGFEPQDIKQLSRTKFDTYLVNDSNYYLAYTWMKRASDVTEWTTIGAGVVEPNIELLLGEVEREDLIDMDRVALQYIAYKLDKPFEARQPAFIEMALDTTKFAKLHCFHDNQYFDTSVIALEMVTNGVPYRRQPVPDAAAIQEAMRTKRAAERPTKRPVSKKAFRPGELVVDLHIHELVDSTRGMSSADMLNLQIDKFRQVMDENRHNRGKKIIFIHGKGEGVLRNAIMKELNHRYKGHQVQDASFREYGFGATQVTI